MSFLSDAVAVVTGAGSGIGRALAQQLAATGSALALADIDEAGLLETAQSLEKRSALVTTHVLDVADVTFLDRLCRGLFRSAEAALESVCQDLAGLRRGGC